MTPDQHPTIRLFYALNALNIVLGNTNNFRRLVEERAKHDEWVHKIRDFNISVWNADRKRSGTVPKELIEPKERSYPYESEAMIESLKAILANGEEAVESALNALSTGGGDALDAALNPGASNKTIRLRTKLDEAKSLFGITQTTLTMPNVLLDSSVEKMDDLASWFQQISRELGAVIDTNQATVKNEPSAEETYHPANYFPQKMCGRIRMAAAPDRKTKRVRKQEIDGVICYCVQDAERWWPEDMEKSRQSAQG